MLEWLERNIKLVLGIVAVAGLLTGAGHWVAQADEAHKDARKVEQLVTQNAEILQELKKRMDTEEAVKQEREKLAECVRANPDDLEKCL